MYNEHNREIDKREHTNIIAPIGLYFKLIFGNQANADILAAFLRSLLDLPQDEYDTLTIVDPHLNREGVDGKLSVLDVKIRTKSGKTVAVEIQISPIFEMRERIAYYAARLITDQMGKGESYSIIKKVISIVITDYVLINENEDYHNRYTLYNPRTYSEFTDIIEVDVLELPKLASDGDGSELCYWMQFLKSNSEEELNMLAQRSAPLKKAVGVLMELSADERTRLLYDAHEKARRDEMSRTQSAIKTERIKIAKNAINIGLSVDDIVKLTGLPNGEVEELRVVSSTGAPAIPSV